MAFNRVLDEHCSKGWEHVQQTFHAKRYPKPQTNEVILVKKKTFFGAEFEDTLSM